MLDRDFGAHGLQTLDVLIHRAGADGTAAWQGDRGFAEARQQGPQRQHRGAHGLDQFVRRFGGDRVGGVQRYAAALPMGLGFHAHVVQQAAHGGHVLQAGHVGQCDRLGGQQGRAQLGQGGILGAGNQDLAVQLATPANDEFVH